MATTNDYIKYVCEQINGVGIVTYKKMFGEYLVYVDNRPIITVCDNICYVKMLDCIKDIMSLADVGFPYKGAKEHYILDIDNKDLSKEVVSNLSNVIMPKNKK